MKKHFSCHFNVNEHREIQIPGAYITHNSCPQSSPKHTHTDTHTQLLFTMNTFNSPIRLLKTFRDFRAIEGEVENKRVSEGWWDSREMCITALELDIWSRTFLKHTHTHTQMCKHGKNTCRLEVHEHAQEHVFIPHPCTHTDIHTNMHGRRWNYQISYSRTV